MSEHQKHTVFLRHLIQSEDTEECRQLQARLSKAEEDERVVRCAIALVGLLTALAIAGLVYSAVLMQDFPHNKSQLAFKVFLALGLASFICLVTFTGVWIRCRGILSRLHDECRELVSSALAQGLKSLQTIPFPRTAKHKNFSVYQNRTSVTGESADSLQLQKAL
jgi:hypothetical protein